MHIGVRCYNSEVQTVVGQIDVMHLSNNYPMDPPNFSFIIITLVPELVDAAVCCSSLKHAFFFIIVMMEEQVATVDSLLLLIIQGPFV